MPTYEDVGAASEWLCAAFGFRETRRFTNRDGVVTTAILEGPAGGTVMPGWIGPEYRAPRRHRETCEEARRWSETPYIVDGVLVTVDDADSHCRRSRAAGAVILSEPEDAPPGRLYRAEDPEGHRWMFLAPAAG